MRKESREALDAYFAEADSWAKDRNDVLRGSRRVAWIVSAIAIALAMIEAIALVMLMPLKTVEPHALMIDRNTGFVQDVDIDHPQRLTDDAALTQSFLVQYVVAREGFDIDTINTNYRKVAALSAEQARADYLDHVQPSSPDSPLNLYPRSSVIEVRVKSVSSIEPNVSLVRFDTVRRDAGGRAGAPNHWVAVVRYRYSGEPARVEDRYQNPLGFQVVRYRVDPESLPNEDAAPAAAVRTVPAPVQVAPAPRVVPAPVVPQPQPQQRRPQQPEVEL